MNEKKIDKILFLEKELIVAKTRVETIKDELRKEKLNLIAEEYGVKVGSEIMDEDGKMYIVSDIDTSWNTIEKPFLKGHPERKNGEWSKAVNYIYGNWEVIEK